MNSTAETRYIRASRNAIQREAHVRSPRPPRGNPMDLRCPDCNGADLKRVSLAYQESVRHVDTRTRLRAFLFGSDGPIAFAVWRHNHLRFPREYARWDRSFLCQRCGAVSQHEVP
jgi:hypothetical protein